MAAIIVLAVAARSPSGTAPVQAANVRYFRPNRKEKLFLLAALSRRRSGPGVMSFQQFIAPAQPFSAGL